MITKLKKSNFLYLENFIWQRIFSIKESIIVWCLSSIVDIGTITFASRIFQEITESNNFKNIISLSALIVFVILVRTFLVIILRKYACFKIFEKKNKDELKIVSDFVRNNIYSKEKEKESIESFKELIINSTYAASAKFDIPISAGIAELLFAVLGFIYLLKILGVAIFIINLPIFLLLVIFSRFISKKFLKLGKLIVNGIEKKLLAIDNITAISYELSALKLTSPILKFFNKGNKIYNMNESQTFTFNFINQNVIESFSLIIILLSLLAIVFGILETSLSNSASVLALLSRLVPCITRCLSNYSILQFGIEPIRKLNCLNK